MTPILGTKNDPKIGVKSGTRGDQFVARAGPNLGPKMKPKAGQMAPKIGRELA